MQGPVNNSDADEFLPDLEYWIQERNRRNSPDYRNIVYCDKHLGVEMRLADSWFSIEYGDTSVDVNPKRFWRCPVSGCDRHYEPTMFGYHLDEPGRRLQDVGTQPRGNHPGRPFMYIGKFGGEGRRYKCPYYRCGELGAIVSESVLDERVELPPQDPLIGLKKADRQRALELGLFQKFAPSCGLLIDDESAENGNQGNPDILCTISGQRYWFELGEIVHKRVAEKLNPKRRARDGGFAYDQEQPFVEVVKKKITRRYVTDGLPVDVVLHFDLRFGSVASVRRLCERYADLMKSLTTSGPFKRVWIFNVAEGDIVWHY